MPKRKRRGIKLFRIDHSCDMTFPPVQASASRREIPTFGLPRRLPAPENAGNWSQCVAGQAEAPPNPAAPAAASGDWGSGSWGRDDRCTRRDRGAPAAHNPFAVQRPDFVQQMVIEEEDETRNSLLVIDNRDDRVISFPELAGTRDHVQCRQCDQRADRAGSGAHSQLGISLFVVRELHARWH